jgi:hypothetical protein
MNEPWTPGPWQPGYESRTDGRSRYIVSLGEHRMPVPTWDDARLIAAAPEMAEALDNIHGILQMNLGDADPHIRSACDIAWSLLARVRDES